MNPVIEELAFLANAVSEYREANRIARTELAALKADNAKLRAALANTLAYLEADADDDQERKDHEQARTALNSTQPAP